MDGPAVDADHAPAGIQHNGWRPEAAIDAGFHLRGPARKIFRTQAQGFRDLAQAHQGNLGKVDARPGRMETPAVEAVIPRPARRVEEFRNFVERFAHQDVVQTVSRARAHLQSEREQCAESLSSSGQRTVKLDAGVRMKVGQYARQGFTCIAAVRARSYVT